MRFSLKHISVFLALAVALTGCGLPPPVEVETVVVSFAAYTSQVEYYKQLAEAFHEKFPNIEVQVLDLREMQGEPAGQDSAAYLDYNRRLAEGADVVPVGSFYGGINLYDGIRSGLLYDLRPFLDQEPAIEALFIPKTVDALSWGGSLYALPWSFSVPLMVYNPQRFEAAGISAPAAGWTWEDFLVTAQALVHPGQNGFGFVDATPWNHMLPLALIAQNGGQVIAPQGSLPEANLEDPLAAQSLQWYIDLSAVHRVAPPPSGDVNFAENICPGRVAMWSWDIRFNTTVRSSPVDSCVAGKIAGWPAGKTGGAPLIVNGFGISAGTRDPQAAWQWLTFIIQEKKAVDNFEWPALDSYLGMETLAQERGITQEAVDAVRNTVAGAVPMQIEYDALWPGLLELPKVYGNEKSVSQILQDAARVWAGADAAGPFSVATPASPLGEAQIAIVFVPGRDPFGEFEDVRSYETLAEAFHKENPDIRVEVRALSGFVSTEEIAGQADVFLGARQAPMEQPAEGQYRSLALNLEPLIEADLAFDSRDFLNVRFLFSPGYDGPDVAWGIPVSFDAMGIFYDRAKFQAAHLSEPEAGWTWDDFRLAAVQLTSGEGEARQYGYVSRLDALDLELFLLGRGLSLPESISEDWSQTGGAIDEQLPELTGALTWWIDLAQGDGGMAPIALPGPSLLEQRRAAMWADYLGNFKRGQYPDAWDLGFAPMPRGEHPAAAIRYRIAYISANTQAHEACWRWVRYLADHPVGSLAPARWSLLRSEGFKEQVGAEMQSVYLQAAELYEGGETVVDRVSYGSTFLLTFLQAIREGQGVDAALNMARGAIGQ